MKLCDDRWREELVDHILGSPASAALTEHVEKCVVCSAALRESEMQMRQIDAGIRRLVASEPAAHAAPRIMAEVRARSQPVRLPGWTWRTATLFGLALVVASFIYLWKIHEQRKEADQVFSAASAIGSWRSPTEGLLRSSTDQLFKASPRLGKYFYQLSTGVPEKEKQTP